MPDREHDLSHDDPEGGHDPDALEDAAERMHATKAGKGEHDRSKDDPEGGHDKGALKDAAEKMGTERS